MIDRCERYMERKRVRLCSRELFTKYLSCYSLLFFDALWVNRQKEECAIETQKDSIINRRLFHWTYTRLVARLSANIKTAQIFLMHFAPHEK